jgi:hypothetical protein
MSTAEAPGFTNSIHSNPVSVPSGSYSSSLITTPDAGGGVLVGKMGVLLGLTGVDVAVKGVVCVEVGFGVEVAADGAGVAVRVGGIDGVAVGGVGEGVGERVGVAVSGVTQFPLFRDGRQALQSELAL